MCVCVYICIYSPQYEMDEDGTLYIYIYIYMHMFLLYVCIYILLRTKWANTVYINMTYICYIYVYVNIHIYVLHRTTLENVVRKAISIEALPAASMEGTKMSTDGWMTSRVSRARVKRV